MKNNRKGFTLVELVIVIAVIAILAGVLIGTFASVLKRANDSARVQQIKNDEIAQKADDIIKKIEDSNWFGWEDFEASLVAKMTEAYKKNTSGDTITEESIQKVVKKALEEYAANQATQNTALTEDQVKAIVENAIGGIKFSGVTEAQVRSIVNAAVSTISGTQLTAAQVRAIVNAANENNLTANDLARALADLPTNTTIENLETSVKNAINNITRQLLSKEDVADVIAKLVPVTKEATDATDAQTLFSTLVSGSTIVLDNITGPLNFTISDAETKTIILANNTEVPYTGKITISGARATVYLIGDFTEVVAEKVDSNSIHVLGTVNSLTIKQGRAVVENGATVNVLTAQPNENTVVTVVVEETANVVDLNAQYQDHGYAEGNRDYIEIENKGTVGNTTISASDALVTSQTTTTNVVIKNGNGSTGTAVDDVNVATGVGSFDVTVDDVNTIADGANGLKVDLFASGSGTELDPYIIATAKQMQNITLMYSNDVESYYQIKTGITTIDCSNWESVNLYGHFNGKNVSFVNLDAPLFNRVCSDTETCLKNFTVTSNIITSDAFSAVVVYKVVSDVSFENVDVHGYLQAGQCASYVAFGPGQSTVINYTFKDCHSDCTLVAISEKTAGFIDHPFCKDGAENTLTLINSYYDGKQSNPGDIYYYYTYQTFGRLTVSDDNENLASVASGNNYVKANSTKKLTISSLTLPAVGEIFSVAKTEGATHAIATLLIGPNDKNEVGNYVGTYMAEACNLTGDNFVTVNVKNYNITINDDTTEQTEVTGNTFNIVNNSYGTTYGSASVTIVQYDANDNIVAIYSASIKR